MIAHVLPLRSSEGRLQRHFAGGSDSPERVAGRLQHLLHILPSGVVILDGFGRVADANQIAVELLGEPLSQQRWIDVIQRAFAPRADDGHEVSLRDGRRVRIETRALDPEPGQLILLTDLTETRQLQEQLGHQHRLQALGKMMASLAHQLKTPLATATLYSAHLADPLLPEARRQTFADKVQHSLHSLTQQIDDMLLFVRSGETPVRPLALSELLTELALLHEDSPLRFEWPSAEQIPAVELLANPEALLGAFNNLIHNSLQAGASQCRLQLKLIEPGWLQLQLQDNGPGMSESVLARALEPFYTTKTAGTGLGLAVVAAVVNSHQGRLQLQSKPAEGLTVSLSFPVRNAGAMPCHPHQV